MKRVLELGRLADGKPFTLPLDFVTRTAALVAIRGGGKTVAATVIAEEMCEAGLPWIAFDPTPGGVWWGLRVNPDGSPGGYPVVVLGGQHADLPFDRALAVQVAEAFARENICVVIDVSQETKTTWRAFVADFCDRLMELTAPTPRHVFIEEAPEFVPQRPVAEQKRSRAAVDRLVRLGRNAGYGATLLSQRFATVDKDVLTQCENILALRSVGKPDRKAVRDWVAECVSPEPDDPVIEEFLGSLPSLADGEGWFWSPQWLKQFERVRIRERKTLHPGRTRSVDEAPLQVKLSDVRDFVDRFRTVLEVKPKAPRKLLVEAPVSVERTETRRRGALDSGVRVVPVAALQTRAEEAEAEAGRLRGQVADLHRQLGAAKSTITALRQVLEPQYRAMQRLFQEMETAAPPGIDLAVWTPWLQKLSPPGKKVLQVLLDRGGEATRSQIRTLAHISDRYMRDGVYTLSGNGLIEQDGQTVKLRVP